MFTLHDSQNHEINKSRFESAAMAGFDCQFVQQPPEFFQTQCSMCLLVLCEPYQVSCCGKSFCRKCIEAIQAKSQPCPTCNRRSFNAFHNKGLQQPLYGFRVFCSNKESGCAWEGELGQLDKHVNSNPDKEKQLVGCAYTNVMCVYCDKLCKRDKIQQHQASLCARRPFTCKLCKEYKSTYNDVISIHTPVCKCRPVSCPNSCGVESLQHQHLIEHMSSHCPLTYVECEFSDAGCDAKVRRKDLPFHLTDNIVTHMSLLAVENRKLKQQLKKQSEEISKQSVVISNQAVQVKNQIFEHDKKLEGLVTALHPSHVRVPPIDFLCPVSIAEECGTWLSQPFHSHIGGCEIQLKCEFISDNCSLHCVIYVSAKLVQRNLNLHLTAVLVSHSECVKNHTVQLELSRGFTRNFEVSADMFKIGRLPNGVYCNYVKNSHLLFRISSIVKTET